MAQVLNTFLAQAAQNLTENAKNATEKISTPEGRALAYGSLSIMAVVPIIVGSYRSVTFSKKQDSKDQSNKMGQSDALKFPLVASAFLFGLYIVFKVFSKEYLNYIITGYFSILGIYAVTTTISPLMKKVLPSSIPYIPFQLSFTHGEGDNQEYYINLKFTSYDCVALTIASVMGAAYLVTKNWVINNIFGLAFSINAIELLHLNNMITGCYLLGGLFLYDIFWVFFTDVMVSVAKNFDAPIKFVFPQDIFVKGVAADNFAMLGLGDIVIPGIFIALLLRFDQSLKRKSNTYFNATIVAYFLGLSTTMLVLHFFKHAQPALLYLVPFCLGTAVLVALVKGDIKTLFKYDEEIKEPKKDEDKKSKEAKKVR